MAQDQRLLARVEQEYDREDNPYVQAARCLWEAYQGGSDVKGACRVMQWTVQRAGPGRGALWRGAGYATEQLPLDELCPLGD